MSQDVKIAVTGATGLLGSHLVAELIRDGYTDITLLLRDAGRLPKVGDTVLRETGEVLPPWVKVREVQLNDPYALDEALRGVDVVFHCAAIVSLGVVSPAEIIENNVEVTAHVVDACLRAGVGLLVHVSSIAALGEARDGERFIDEKCDIQRLEKTSPYSVSKFFSENEVRRGMAKGLQAVIVNPAVILGVGDWLSGGSTLIIPFVARGIPFYTMGVMGYVDVRDVARAMVLLSREPKAVGERFILSSENISYKDFISTAAAYAGRRKPWIRAGRRMLAIGAALDKLYSWITGSQPKLTAEVISNAVGKSYYDGSKVTRYVDFKYTPVGDTIKRVVKDYIEHHE